MATRLSPRVRALIRESDLEVTVAEFSALGGWRGVFGVDPGQPLPLWLELGIGKDPHLVERAARQPDAFFVGIEHSKKKLDKVHAKALQRGVRNIRLLRADIFRILDPLFDDGSLDGTFVLFPDPWPKKRHAKKRMVQGPLLDVLARKLRPGAQLELRTDHPNYAQQMLDCLEAQSSFESALVPGRLSYEPHPNRLHLPTLFETKFAKRGLTLHYLYYDRIEDPDAPPSRPPYPPEKLADYDPMQGSPDEVGATDRPWIDADHEGEEFEDHSIEDRPARGGQ